jgi:hypothetical protein
MRQGRAENAPCIGLRDDAARYSVAGKAIYSFEDEQYSRLIFVNVVF